MGLQFGENALTTGRFTNSQFDGYAVTPSDTVDLPNGPCQAICVTGVAGNVAVNLDADSTAIVTVAAVNEIYPMMVSRIKATNTTANTIWALYKKG
jgi:hypothetical protein